jgi:hypothetical protein
MMKIVLAIVFMNEQDVAILIPQYAVANSVKMEKTEKTGAMA